MGRYRRSHCCPHGRQFTPDGVESSLVSLGVTSRLNDRLSGVHRFFGIFSHVCIRFSHYKSVYVARYFSHAEG